MENRWVHEGTGCFVSYKKVDGQRVQEWEGPAEMKCYYRSDNYVVETKVEQADCSNVEKYLFQTHTLTHTQKHQKHLRVSPWLPWPLVVISRLEMCYARNTMYSKNVSESKATPPRSAFLLHSWFSSDWRNWISDVECPHPPHYNTRRLVNRNHHLNIPKVSCS